MFNLSQRIKISHNDVKDAVIDKPFTIYKLTDGFPKNISSLSVNSPEINRIYTAVECNGNSSFNETEYYYDFEDEYSNRCRNNIIRKSNITVLFTTVELIGGEVFFEITLVATIKQSDK